MSTPQRPPRSRSPFAAAFLSLIFPGLGHAYAGAWARALAFAALPLLSLALVAGIALRVDRFELLGFVIQQPVLVALLVVNLALLVYRIVAAVDAWQVARFLNAADASGGGRLGRARLPDQPALDRRPACRHPGHGRRSRGGGPLQRAGAGSRQLRVLRGRRPDLRLARHLAVARQLPRPLPVGRPGEAPSASAEVLPTPLSSAATGTQAPTLPPWDGKGTLNVLLVGVDQRADQTSFNTDTMIVVSVDPKSKQVAMFQIPRDTVDVPVPANARSVWGSVYRGKINSWFVQNRNRTDLWPGKTAQARGFNVAQGDPGRAVRYRHPLLRRWSTSRASGTSSTRSGASRSMSRSRSPRATTPSGAAR